MREEARIVSGFIAGVDYESFLGNVIVHDYEEVDFSVIWQTATESIPELIAAVNRIESDLGKELFGASEREKNRQIFLQALEEADARNGDV
ncbi:MAG: DUF86 domain-containing protein [Clostridiales Family XIII bacterium]|jgi:hypothetical protein|nr:DUF86 domain-containing protein [Clostridiales Family XIII bacterium]